MIDIFISRPTWVAEEFKEGLTAFLSFLDTHDIKPRTLGSTDYPNDSPLDEVISIMGECQGVIILGYPQIYVTEGKIKEIEKSDFLLPTEWNHIEAALAYMKDMPLLVIHHKGISRGIFERGAIGKFIYEKDLSKPNWFLSENITGALKKWKAAIKEPKTSKTTIPKTAPKPVPKQPSEEGRLPEDVESVLVYFFKEDTDRYRNSSWVKSHFGLNEQASKYYLEVLRKRKMIVAKGRRTDGEPYYALTSKGRAYVMTNKLISFKR